MFVPGGSFGAAAFGKFDLGGVLSATSAFQGTAPSTAAATSEDVGNLGAQCGGAGVKTIHIGLGPSTQ